MHQDADKPVITRARLPLLDDKPRARWKRTITPGGESVWTSTVGEVVFSDLPPDDRDGDTNILTLEERLEGPPGCGKKSSEGSVDEKPVCRKRNTSCRKRTRLGSLCGLLTVFFQT